MRQTRYIALAAGLALAAGCHLDMWNQPRYEPLEASEFFPQAQSARPVVEGAVAFEQPYPNTPYYTGLMNGEFVTGLPVEVSRELLERGQGRFNVFCAPCHGRTGDGRGMASQRGDWQQLPASFHEPRLREMPAGQIFSTITNGYRFMFPYASRVTPDDRWAIVAYIRALQLSHNAEVGDAPPEVREQLQDEQRTEPILEQGNGRPNEDRS